MSCYISHPTVTCKKRSPVFFEYWGVKRFECLSSLLWISNKLSEHDQCNQTLYNSCCCHSLLDISQGLSQSQTNNSPHSMIRSYGMIYICVDYIIFMMYEKTLLKFRSVFFFVTSITYLLSQ